MNLLKIDQNKVSCPHSLFDDQVNMSTFIAAMIATLITTGMTSAISHDLTLVGGSVVTVILTASMIGRRNVSVYPVFLFGAISMAVIAIVSSEARTSQYSSTIHVLSMYVALIGLAFSCPDLSKFCQHLMMGNNVLLTGWILYQGYDAEPLKAWQISSPTGAANIMPAEVNMTLPLILMRVHESTGQKKLAYLALIFLNCIAVFLVMSRNGIGTLLIILTMYIFYDHKRIAVFLSCGIISIGASSDSIIQTPWVHSILLKMRFVGYNATAPRSVIWRVAWDRIVEHPMLGVGPGGPKQALAVVDIYHAHNNFIQVALETGIPSALIFITMFLLLLSLPAKTILQSRERFLVTLPIVAYFSYSLTAMPLSFSGMTLLLAACVHEARLVIQRKSQQTVPQRISQQSLVGRRTMHAA